MARISVDISMILNYYLIGIINNKVIITTTLEKLEELIYKGFKETDLKFKETNLEIEKVNRQVGNITDSLGRFAENMVAPAIVKIFNQRGIPITDYSQRVRSSKRRIEYDVVAFNENYAVVVSVKLTLRPDDVKRFLEERLPIFKEVFPRYKEMKVKESWLEPISSARAIYMQ